MKPNSLIRRRKTYRDEKGVIVGYGAEEAYFVANPRDYNTHPLREGEKRIRIVGDREIISIVP